MEVSASSCLGRIKPSLETPQLHNVSFPSYFSRRWVISSPNLYFFIVMPFQVLQFSNSTLNNFLQLIRSNAQWLLNILQRPFYNGFVCRFAYKQAYGKIISLATQQLICCRKNPRPNSSRNLVILLAKAFSKSFSFLTSSTVMKLKSYSFFNNSLADSL